MVSAFLDNVTTLVLIAPITLLICQLLELDPVLFLIYEAIFSNLGGTATLVGDPPNVLIGSQGHIPFMAFIDHLTPVVLICMIVISLALIPIFRNRLHVSPRARAILRKADPAKAIVNPGLLKQALPVFLLILVGFFAGHTLHLEPGYVAIVGAVLMLLVTRQPIKAAMDAVQWETLAFFTGLFMLIGTLAEQGVFEWAAKEVFALSHGHLLAASMLILWFCGLFSAVVDNIPVVLAMIPLIHTRSFPSSPRPLGLTPSLRY
ncbi:MAG: anion permease [Candidatus Hydrogenedentes bacterium]|nr:anion permease [Candidatus Hydrogenedentota bacterium]